jgi:ribosomal protein L29
MRADNSHHLAEAARRRREQTLTRARQALQQLEHSDQPVTIATVAAHAGVSRAWLYAENDLRARIVALRHRPARTTTATTTPATEPGSVESLRNRLALAHQRIRELDDQNRQLRDQIARLHGQLRTSKISNSHDVDTVHDTNNLVTLQVDQERSR